MQADVRWLKYTDIVEDESIEEGVIRVLRDKEKQFNLLIEFQKPYPYFVSVRGTKVEIYRPKIATVEEYDLSKSREMLEQALLLGFGTAGRVLRENYELKMEGEEKAAGTATVKIELVPKSEKMRTNMPRLENVDFHLGLANRCRKRSTAPTQEIIVSTPTRISSETRR